MAVELQVFDFTFKNTDTIAIPQFAAVCYDTTNVFGAVNAGSANAGAVIGINQSKGIDPTTGAITSSVQVGQSMTVRLEGISRAAVAGVTTIGQPLSVQNASGQVGVGASTFASGGLVGYGLEAGTVAGDIISLLVNPGLQPALKQLGTFAAPLTANAVINTEKAHPHSLGYKPHIQIFISTGGTPGTISISNGTDADATNVYSKASVASATFLAFVA